ncbi:class I SAM-dependent methyltransferase [Methanoculleus taiwanensis]|uniref:class I SAM-dependent methyltransferase n=1 Tax=Methanoculleus taiwanensis TaxID=1550565 RepID=UPI00240E8B60|nr:class I SAM-dependent methyltransferase family protein [Methanoculleus taiwanensis]
MARGDAEAARRRLAGDGMLDRTLKPRMEGELLLLPVVEPCEGARECEFEAFPERVELPRHELIGGIAIMQEEDPAGAERLLASRPSLHTVLLPESAVEGEYRTRRYTVLAGTPTTKTRYTEYGLRFDLDLGLAYFSARLSTERQRLLSLVQEGECILDMFAGVGPFAITLARRARVVFAADLNPDAVHLMIRNLALNRTGNVIPILADAGHLDRIGMPPLDRIIMNLPLAAPQFLTAAANLCRDGGWIHLYALQEQPGEFLPLIDALPVGDVREQEVRTYSPGKWHAVYDIRIEKEE